MIELIRGITIAAHTFIARALDCGSFRFDAVKSVHRTMEHAKQRCFLDCPNQKAKS